MTNNYFVAKPWSIKMIRIVANHVRESLNLSDEDFVDFRYILDLMSILYKEYNFNYIVLPDNHKRFKSNEEAHTDISKGKSNLYGYGKRGQPTDKINFKYAKYFSNNKREDHVKRHGNKEMGLTTNQYLSKALAFANKADYENHDSFVVQSGKTFKYSFKTKSFQ